MNILFLSGQYPPRVKGGGEVSTHLLARGLVEAGYSVTVLTEGDRRAQPTSSQKEEENILDGVRVVESGVDMTGKVLFERMQARMLAVRVLEEIEGGNYEVVHAHDWRSALALGELMELASRKGLQLPKIVATARDYAQISGSTNNIHGDGTLGGGSRSWGDIWSDHRITEVTGKRKLQRLAQFWMNIEYRRRLFARLPAQVFISEAQRREIAKYQDLTRQQTAVIYNPVPEEYLQERPATGQDGNVLYVGRVEMYKGVELLLKAWRRIAEQEPDGHLTIVGEGAQREAYEQQVERWGLQYRVTFKGFVLWEQLMNIYDQSSVVVAPHLWVEPFGRTVAEAMARGKIVVAAERGGASEMIVSEKNGYLFEPGSVEGLEQKLRQGLGQSDLEREMMGREARNWVKEHLNVKKIADSYLQFYETLKK